jgi:hypothetical protein
LGTLKRNGALCFRDWSGKRPERALEIISIHAVRKVDFFSGSRSCDGFVLAGFQHARSKILLID